MRVAAGQLLKATDLSATLVFALEGSLAGAVGGLDIFGVMVLGFVTALGGGIMRDVLLGERPPAALKSISYLVMVGLGAGAVAVIYQWVHRVPPDLLTWLDAGGLSLFAVTGAAKAVDHRLNPASAVLLGTVSGCGGGVLRDVLLNRVPQILDAHIYAVAAALGALVTVVVLRLGQRRLIAFALGAACCLLLRMLSVELSWNLPHVVQ